ncbi:hypothetical protein C8R46DRAFT_1362493 [Mycena filopes]|nr:hypothetical protein C8R46DRAFT_1362493 [Mycena filopes]
MQDPKTPAHDGKKRRLRGACDQCAKRKIRCDSGQMPENRCTNCINGEIQCTHAIDSSQGATEASFSDFIRAGKAHVAAVLSRSVIYIPSNDPDVSHQLLLEVCYYARSLEEKLAGDDVETLHTPEPDPLPVLNQPKPYNTKAFYGPASSLRILQCAVKFIQWAVSNSPATQQQQNCLILTQPWENIAVDMPPQVFPPDDLLKSLVTIYFEQINPILDILHLPSFCLAVADGLHLRDRTFGAVVLTVCAVASRYSDDPRVFLGEAPASGAGAEHSCGWKWFHQVKPFRLARSSEHSMHLLQVIVLSIAYLGGTATPEEIWMLTGIGIRLAQGGGAHHRNGYERMDPLTAELTKRVFWLLVCSDATIGAVTGRPNMTRRPEMDLDLPLVCDHKYWGTPGAVQPSGQPSVHAYLAVHVRLMLIFARIQRNVGAGCSEDTIAGLDSELNEWVDTVPEHLKWDPLQENLIFLDQSAALYAIYYHAQILIHRPYIRNPGEESASARFPSLAICANAARACGHVLDVQARRGRGLLHLPPVTIALFDSVVLLLINVWDVAGRNQRTANDLARAAADAQGCLRILRLYERRWPVAAKKCGVISSMLDFARYTSGLTLKRRREVDAEVNADLPDSTRARPLSSSLGADQLEPSSLTDPSPLLTPSPSPTQQMRALEDSLAATNHLFLLPLHTAELGRLPVFDSFEYEFGLPLPTTVDMPLQSEWGPAPPSGTHSLVSSASILPELAALNSVGAKMPDTGSAD